MNCFNGTTFVVLSTSQVLFSVTYEVIKASVKKSRQSSKHKQMQYNNKLIPAK